MQRSNLEELLLSSVESALVAVFGPTTAKAVDFYVDRHIALANPAEYSRSMQRIFGEPANVLLGQMIEGISKRAGLDTGNFSTLEECIHQARSKLNASAG